MTATDLALRALLPRPAWRVEGLVLVNGHRVRAVCWLPVGLARYASEAVAQARLRHPAAARVIPLEGWTARPLGAG